MSRNINADYNLFAVSANAAQSAMGVEQTLDTTMLIAKANIFNLDPRREGNKDEATGREEGDMVYDLGNFSSGPFEPPRAQVQHFAFLYAYGLGVCSPAAWGTGYKHTITATSAMSLPCFTGALRYGQLIGKRRFADLFVDTIKSTFAKDDWAKVTGSIKGSGKFTDSIVKEQVTAAYNATELTLAANGVQGADAATRLDNVHQIRVLVPATGEWVEVAYSAVSDATPAIITIAAPGGEATQTTYELLYQPTESAWMSFPPRVIESPLRVTDLIVNLGGKWNGTTILGGRALGMEIKSIEHNLNNSMAIEFRVGGTGTYANYAARGGRTQTIALNREMRDWILQQRLADNEHFTVYAKATGAEFEAGKNYFIEMVWPKCYLLKSPISVDGKFLGEAGDLEVFEDDTYGSVWMQVGNQVSAYAA